MMGRPASKRSQQSNDDSPTTHSASKKRKTEKKIAPKRVEREVNVDPFLKSFCEKFKQPEDAIQFLLQNAKMSVADFIKDHWGVKPIAIQCDEAVKDLGKIFTLEFFEDIVEQSENGEIDLIPERDFIFSKVEGEGHVEAQVSDISKELFKKHYENKFAVLFNQPQRFQESIWAFMEKLECFLGSLVTCQALLVPEGTQSHPLRYDDTEKFIVQLSGSTSWKLYTAKGEQINAFNDEVKQEDVGEECLAATLKAGDVLYIPKGTIFESTAKEESVYLDFGTSQGLSYANLLNQTLTDLIEEQAVVCRELRQVLPPGFLMRPSLVSKKDYAAILNKLAESIIAREKSLPPAEGLIHTFMATRLPPFGMPKFDSEQSVDITKTSKIALKNKEHITWFVRKAGDSSMDEDDVDEESSESRDLGTPAELVVLSSLNNDRSRHMMIDSALTDSESDVFSIAVEYKEVLEKLAKSEKPIAVESLVDGIENGDSIDTMVLAVALNNIGAISVSE